MQNLGKIIPRSLLVVQSVESSVLCFFFFFLTLCILTKHHKEQLFRKGELINYLPNN